jgi:hypothetical protein
LADLFKLHVRADPFRQSGHRCGGSRAMSATVGVRQGRPIGRIEEIALMGA